MREQARQRRGTKNEIDNSIREIRNRLRSRKMKRGERAGAKRELGRWILVRESEFGSWRTKTPRRHDGAKTPFGRASLDSAIVQRIERSLDSFVVFEKNLEALGKRFSLTIEEEA